MKIKLTQELGSSAFYLTAVTCSKQWATTLCFSCSKNSCLTPKGFASLIVCSCLAPSTLLKTVVTFFFPPHHVLLSFSSLGFPCGSAGKESACNVGDLGLIPGFGRSPGEGKGYPFQYSGLVSQRVGQDLTTFTFNLNQP